MRTRLLGAALATFAASACVADEADPGRPDDAPSADLRDDGKGDGENCDSSLSAEAYYDQFAYRALDERAWPAYRVGMTWQAQPTLDNGDKVSLTGYFLPEGRVIIEYAELHAEGGGYAHTNETVVITQATIDPETRAISLRGLGTGTPMTFTSNGRCAPAVDFTFSTDLRSAGLEGDGAMVVTGSSSRFVIDPDNLDDVPSESARRWFQEDVASGRIKIIRL